MEKPNVLSSMVNFCQSHTHFGCSGRMKSAVQSDYQAMNFPLIRIFEFRTSSHPYQTIDRVMWLNRRAAAQVICCSQMSKEFIKLAGECFLKQSGNAAAIHQTTWNVAMKDDRSTKCKTENIFHKFTIAFPWETTLIQEYEIAGLVNWIHSQHHDSES